MRREANEHWGAPVLLLTPHNMQTRWYSNNTTPFQSGIAQQVALTPPKRSARLPLPPPPTPLSTQVCSRVFGAASGLVDMLVSHIPSSKVATANKVARLYTGPQDPDSPIIQFMSTCSRSGGRFRGVGVRR